MNFKKMNRVVKFSIRKFSIGAVSVSIGALLLGVLPTTVSAEQKGQVSKAQQEMVDLDFRYVDYATLTKQEEKMIRAGIPKASNQNDLVYMVYKKANTSSMVESVLPQTGDNASVEILLGSALFIVVALAFSKNKKKQTIANIILVTSLGNSILLSNTGKALEEGIFEKYQQTFSVAEGTELSQAVIDISGYDYVGYITYAKSNLSTPSTSKNTGNGEVKVVPREPVQVSQQDRKQNQSVEPSLDNSRLSSQTSKGSSVIAEEKPAAPLPQNTQETLIVTAKGDSLVSEDLPTYTLPTEDPVVPTPEEPQLETAKSASLTTEALPTYDLSGDTDGDGVSNETELTNGTDVDSSDSYPVSKGDSLTTEALPTYDLSGDTDGDGVSNETELTHGTDTTSSDSYPVSKGASLTTEILPTYDLSGDTDGDGVSNETELVNGTDVASSDSYPVSKGASLTTETLPTYDLSGDTDGDGVSNETELTNGTDVASSDSYPTSKGNSLVSEDLPTYTLPTEDPVAPTPEEPQLETSKGDSLTTESLPVYDLSGDTDGDGVSNETELANGTDVNSSDSYPTSKGDSLTTEILPTYDLSGDTDGDGVSNETELTNGTDTSSPDSYPVSKGESLVVEDLPTYDLSGDTDGDGVSNETELANGTDTTSSDSYPTSKGDSLTTEILPTYDLSGDTDGDGVSNETELMNGTDTTSSDSYPVSKGDSLTTETLPTYDLSGDTDGDGVSNETELTNGTDTTSSDSYPVSKGDSLTTEALPVYDLSGDTDGDGVSNETELANGTDVNSSDSYPTSKGDSLTVDTLPVYDFSSLEFDKTELNAKLTEISSKVQEEYTKASWSQLKSLREQAEALESSPSATQEQIDQAALNLANQINALVKLKAQPTLTLVSKGENVSQKQANLEYSLTDKDSAYVSALVKLYKGSEQISEVSLDNLQATLANLELNTDYQIETTYTYDLGDGQVTKTLPTENLDLVYKQIEIKDVDEVTLVKLENGQTSRVIGLESIPSDLSNYFVTIKSDRFKDILLPISKISDSSNGRYTVEATQTDLQQSNTGTVKENFTFDISKIAPAVNNVYTSFKDLVQAINASPSGHFIIGADMTANEMTSTDNSYITSTFTGTLTGNHNNQQYTIYDLSKSFFNKVENGRIEQLNLVDAHVSSTQAGAGILANTVKNTSISDVAVEGSITAPNNVGGLVYEATDNSHLSNLSFKGEVITQAEGTEMTLGGLVGKLKASTLSKAYGDVAISTNVSTGQHAGGAVGLTESKATINHVYVTGSLNNSGGGRTGGFIGNQTDAKMDDVVTAVKVVNGGIFSGMGYSNTAITNDFAVEGVSTGSNGYGHNKLLTSQEAQERLSNMGITATTTDQSKNQLKSSLDYATLENYQASHATAYANVEKLTPLYSGTFIVGQGNKIASSDKLYTTAILSVTPMVNQEIVNDLYTKKDQINRLMIHYADGTVAYKDLTTIGEYNKVMEYLIADTDLIYTPQQFMADISAIVDSVASQLKTTDLYSDAVWNLLGKEFSTTELEAKKKDLGNSATDAQALASLKHEWIERLDLDTVFGDVKASLTSHLNAAIAQGQVYDVSQASIKNYLSNYLKTEGLALILGTAYMNRMYNINFGTQNIKELATYHQDFFGNTVNHLEWLASIGKSYNKMQVGNNLGTFNSSIAQFSGKDLRNYLSAFRTLFTTMSEDEWFKSATKAYIAEATSNEVPTANVSTYEKLFSRENPRLILPLLSLTNEGVYIVSNMSTLSLGLFDRYMDMSLKETNPTQYAQDLQALKNKITQYAGYQRDHFDMWYRVLNDEVKDKLYTASKVPVMVWDGYNIPRWGQKAGYWMQATGSTASSSMKEFFGPLKWFRSNGAGAYATGSEVFMIIDALITQYGNSTFTHEMVHNFDSEIYLNGYGRRDGIGPEGYALGLLQTPTMANPSTKVVGINSSVNFAEISNKSNKAENVENRLYNLSPERFQNQSDIEQYLKRSYDVLYTLDLAEANSITSLEKSDQKLLLRTLEAVKKSNATNATEIMRNFTDAEWENLSLTSLDALIDNHVIMGTQRTYLRNGSGSGAEIGQNGYDDVLLFAPLYSAHTNTTGSSGTLTFKQTAFEMWAEGGYNAFLNYATNKLKSQAQAEGKTFSDQYVLSKTFDGKYSDFASFKKAIYQERKDKVANLKPITFTYEGKVYSNQTYADIVSLLDTAVQADVAQRKEGTSLNETNSKAQTLKEAIYRAYLFSTDDFRESVYNN